MRRCRKFPQTHTEAGPPIKQGWATPHTYSCLAGFQDRINMSEADFFFFLLSKNNTLHNTFSAFCSCPLVFCSQSPSLCFFLHVSLMQRTAGGKNRFLPLDKIWKVNFFPHIQPSCGGQVIEDSWQASLAVIK